MQLAMGLTTEVPSMPVSHSVVSEKRTKPDRRAWDTLTPYRSGKTRKDWPLALGARANGRCVCNLCGDGFGSVGAFDKHQRINSRGEVVCLDPATLGMERNGGGWWVTPNPLYGEQEVQR